MKSIRQLHLKFPPDVSRPEVFEAVKKIFAEYGRRGGLKAEVTKARRDSAKALMWDINSRKKLAKEMGLTPAGAEHIYINANDPIVKTINSLRAKVTNLERLTKQKTVKSSSRARGLARKKRGSHEP